MKKVVGIVGGLFWGLVMVGAYALDLPPPGAAALGNSGYTQASSMSLPTPATTPSPLKYLSLKEAILLALRNNPDVESSELQRVVDKFGLEVARSQFYPQFTLGGTAQFAQHNTASYSLGPGVTVQTPIGTTVNANYGNAFTGGPGNATLTITQPLLKGAGFDFNMINLLNAEDNEVIARLNFKNSIITAVINVITAYRSLVQDYNNLDIQQRTLLRTQQTVEQAKLQVKAGRMAPSDLLQQQANLATTRLSMIQQKSSLDSDYQRFLQSLGLISTTNIQIDKQIEVTDYHIPALQKSIQLAMENNINYQSAIIALRATKRAVLAAKNQQRWQLDVTASTVVGTNTGNGTIIPPTSNGTPQPGGISAGSNGPSVGFTLNIPIDNKNNQQQLVDAKVALERAKIALEEQKQQLIRDVTNQLIQLRNQYQQIQIAINAVNLQEKTLSNAQLKLKYGRSTVFEVNQLQDQLLQEQTSLISAKIQFLNQITTLSQTLGTTLRDWGITLRY